MRSLLSTARLLVAAITLVALVVQFLESARHGRSLFNFFSFFTIQSNMLAVFVLAVTAFSQRYGNLRGAATLYMAITGVVYGLLLRGLDLQLTLPLVNVVLHDVTPFAMVVDWLVAPSVLLGAPTRIVAAWLVYPLAYCAFSLVRGSIDGWYPYPFLNPAQGPVPLAVTAAAITLAFVVIGTLLAGYARRRALMHP